MTTLCLRKSISRSPLRLGFLLITLLLACFALSPTGQAVTPAPDGGYPGFNTAEGDNALLSLTTGTSDTAIGAQALQNNTTGSLNTATGVNALLNNISGLRNTATGANALFSNMTGGVNTANGFNALRANTTGTHNTATGVQALVGNTTGNGNTAFGIGTLAANTNGSFNIAVGYNAGGNLTTGRDNIDIGNLGVAGESNTMRIGTVKQTVTYIAGISGASVPGGVGVIIDSSGHLGTVVSSARFKDEIKPMDNASEGLFALKPVTFRYKKEIDADRIPQFGLVAEDVAKVNPDLVARDAEGKVYTVRYDAVNAMLLNEFLKEHKKVEQLQATVAQQQKDFQATVGRQQKQIEALTAGLQKVSAELEVSRPAPQVAAENP